ncbi:MAG: L,D-transpeptidase, partial [Chloroflexi bacterium]|nr:L,D-transpeptidase [Chloroflexota bacterium]
MTRARWGFIVLLIVVSTFLLSFRKPQRIAGTGPTLEAYTLTPEPVPTQTPTPLALALRPTPEPSFTATRFPTQKPTPTVPPEGTPTATPTSTATPRPFDTRPDLPRYLYVDQNTQHLYVFEQGALVRDIPCSTGLPYSNTYTPAWSGVVREYWG